MGHATINVVRIFAGHLSAVVGIVKRVCLLLFWVVFCCCIFVVFCCFVCFLFIFFVYVFVFSFSCFWLLFFVCYLLFFGCCFFYCCFLTEVRRAHIDTLHEDNYKDTVIKLR